eukprot:scaffold40.g5156.t1
MEGSARVTRSKTTGAAAAAAAAAPTTPQPPRLAASLPPTAAAPAAPNKRRRGATTTAVGSAAPPAAHAVAPPPEEAAATPARFERLAAGQVAEVEAVEVAPAQRVMRGAARRAAVAAEAGEAEAGTAEEGASDGEVEEVVEVKKRRRRRGETDPLPFQEPTPELLQRLAAEGYKPPALPVPNLGYACLNTVLRSLKPPVFCSRRACCIAAERDCIKRTLDAKGLPYLGALCLANARDLARLIQWNHEHDIRFCRMSSVLFPWMGTFKFEDLPQVLFFLCGDDGRAGQLAALDEGIVSKSLAEMEMHSLILDLMGYPPSPWNKINIHVGEFRGAKFPSSARASGLGARVAGGWRGATDTVASWDLLFLHRETGVPLVFDFHHHRFCPGGLTEEEALLAAVATWPRGVRPVVHWSESQAGRKPHAHSDYVRRLPNLYGKEAEVDVMVEAKMKEQAVLCWRGDQPLPPEAAGEEGGSGAEEAE